MLSKLFQYANRFRAANLLRVRVSYQRQSKRVFMGLIPPSQYDVPIPNRFHLLWAMREYWEIIPLVITTAIALGFVVGWFIWACTTKVDIVFSVRSRNNISRTMDLRNPSNHKLVIINQPYKPWPEMQEVLDKMKAAEKRALVRMQTCSHP